MSHFTVGVITKEKVKSGWELEELMAPFSETDETYFEPYMRYTRTEAIQYAREMWDEAEGKTDDELADWAVEDTGYEVDSEGNFIYYSNPNAEWDWWSLGGRWDNMLLNKHTKKYSNSEKLSNLDWKEMSKDHPFETYALLTPDGNWLTSGSMGWFGISTATQEGRDEWSESFRKTLQPYLQEGYYITIVDCHI